MLNGNLICEAGGRDDSNAQRLRDWMQIFTGMVGGDQHVPVSSDRGEPL